MRPEKLAVAAPGASSGDGEGSAAGTVAEVVYAGPVTRFVVDLDAGARLIALEQNGHRAAPRRAARAATPVRAGCGTDEHLIEIPAQQTTASTAQRSSQ